MVGAKFHLIKDHFLQQLDQWGAIGPFNEEFGKSDHVAGNREIRKFGCMRSAARREAAISRSNQMRNNPRIKLVKEGFKHEDKKRRRVMENKREAVKTMRKQVLNEVEYMMETYGQNSDVQIEDYWKK